MIIFEDKEINKVIFTKTKSHLIPINLLTNIDANQILVPKKELYGTNKSIKSCMWYNDDHVIRPLCKKLPQMIGYVKCFNRNKAMSFKVIDKSYTKIWERGSNLINMKLDSEPVYGNNDKYIKTKIKTYRDKKNYL